MLAAVARSAARAPRRLSPIGKTLRKASTAASNQMTTEMEHLEPEKYFAEMDDANVKSHMNKLRNAENDLLTAINAKAAPLDWDAWKKDIKYPGLVDELKQIYDDIPVPDIKAEQEKARQHVDNIFDPIIKDYEQVAEEAEKDTVELEKEVQEYTQVRDNIRNISLEDFLKKYPSVTKDIEQDVENNRWYVDTS